MGSYLNPSSKNFFESINSKIYVDKSELIQHTNAAINTRQKFLCVSRPRRFGKSMGMDMLAAYYSFGRDSAHLFDDLKISKDPNYHTHLNQYNVIKINMQEFLSSTSSMDAMLKQLKKYITFDILDEYEDKVRFRDEDNFVQDKLFHVI